MSFQNKKAWEERYASAAASGQDLFEWYCPFDTVARHVEDFVKVQKDTPDYKVLVIGCGISAFSADLADFGCKDILSIDYSASAIAIQKKRNARSGLKFEVGDVRDMKNTVHLDDNTFDAVFAKGTIDALLCAERANSNINAGMKEINRVLKPGGKFTCISYATEEERSTYFKDLGDLEPFTTVGFPRPSIKHPGGLEEIPENMLYMHVYSKK
eukprot:TRINITY_DN18919_c0_g1_i1.p1 TRINITY_DN18919_c0_g1~~TRINITY_DN18919_c0_g1_i1.p1  ORF type:complete len:213 (+),score=59.16 TRINITY_DN18919_c0_g1_i1:53-691(+)